MLLVVDCKAPTGLLCSGLGPPAQERHGALGVGTEGPRRAEVSLLRKKAGEVGLVWLGKEKALMRPHCDLPVT